MSSSPSDAHSTPTPSGSRVGLEWVPNRALVTNESSGSAGPPLLRRGPTQRDPLPPGPTPGPATSAAAPTGPPAPAPTTTPAGGSTRPLQQLPGRCLRTTGDTDATHPPAELSKGSCPTRDRPRCNGTNSVGGRCRKQPLKGATACRNHRGSAPQVGAAAEQRLLERQALVAAEAFGLPREVDPHTALLEEPYRAAGALQWLGAIVADLDRKDVV
jgi:hypothetical protein